MEPILGRRAEANTVNRTGGVPTPRGGGESGVRGGDVIGRLVRRFLRRSRKEKARGGRDAKRGRAQEEQRRSVWRRPTVRRAVTFSLSLGVCFLALQAGCAGGYSAKEKLGFSLRSFNSGVRWGRHQQAAAHFVDKLRDLYLTRVEEMDERVNISEVEPLRMDLVKKGKIAVVRYRFKWHMDSEMLVKKAVLIQYWYWNDDAWKVVKVTKASGDDFPYFKEVFTKKLTLKELKAMKLRSGKLVKESPKKAKKDRMTKTKSR